MTPFSKLINPDAPPAHKKRLDILSPISGRVKPLEHMPSPVFQQRLLGEGVAIEPAGYQVVAPFDCKIMQHPSTGHQIRIKSPQGLLMLVHIGVGSESLMGEAFKIHHKEGTVVKAGNTLLEFDLIKLKERLNSTYCAVTLLNSDKLKGIQPFYRQVMAAEDPLLQIFV